MTYGIRRFVIDELMLADDGLRTMARTVSGAASDLNLEVSGLPPDAQAVVDGLRGLKGVLGRAEQELLSGARSFGTTAATVLGLDRRGLELMWNSLKHSVLPGNQLPLGTGPWYAGRLATALGAGITVYKTSRGYRHWVRTPSALRPGNPLMPGRGSPWPMFGQRPVPPHIQRLLDRTERVLRYGGNALNAATAFARRRAEGASIPEAVAGSGGETATVYACASNGAKLGARVPGLQTKAAAIVAGGVVGGVACTPVGRAVGDGAEFLAGKAADGASFLGGKAAEGYEKVTPYEGVIPGSVLGID